MVQIKTLFSTNREEVFNIPRPTCAERKGFYEDLIMKQAAEPPASKHNSGKDILHVQLCYCKLTANTVFALVIILCQSFFM